MVADSPDIQKGIAGKKVTVDPTGKVQWDEREGRSLSLERDRAEAKQLNKDLLDLSMAIVSLIGALGADAFDSDPMGMSISEIKSTLADIIQRRTPSDH